MSARAWLLAAGFCALPAMAGDYAWQWPLRLQAGDQPIQRLALVPELYAALQDPLLRDLDIVDGDGRRTAVAFALAAAPPRVGETRTAVAWFPLQATELDSPARLRAVVEAARVVVEAVPAAPAAPVEQLQALLVDLGEDPHSVRALQLQPADPAAAWSLRLQVETSADLAGWRPLRPPVQLYSLAHGGHVLRQWSIEWNGGAERFLRLRPETGPAGAGLAQVARIEARRRQAGVEVEPELASLLLDAAAGEQPGEWRYRLPGPLPVRQSSLQFERSLWVVEFELASRNGDDRPWAPRARGVAYRIDADGEVLASPAERIAPVRDREWRLRLLDPVAAAPRLRVEYVPDQLLFSVEPGKHYAVVAGSGSQRRVDAPMQTLLAALRARRGADWQPPLASLGARGERAGPDALRRVATGDRFGRLLLWAVLVAAALSLAAIALRLLRTQGAAAKSPPESP